MEKNESPVSLKISPFTKNEKNFQKKFKNKQITIAKIFLVW